MGIPLQIEGFPTSPCFPLKLSLTSFSGTTLSSNITRYQVSFCHHGWGQAKLWRTHGYGLGSISIARSFSVVYSTGHSSTPNEGALRCGFRRRYSIPKLSVAFLHSSNYTWYPKNVPGILHTLQASINSSRTLSDLVHKSARTKRKGWMK